MRGEGRQEKKGFEEGPVEIFIGILKDEMIWILGVSMYVACYISMEDEKKKMKVGGEVGLNSRPDMTAFSPPNAPSHK